MARTHAFQAPKGTRDFFPEDMAVRRHLESVWREVAVNHGFDEVDGPTFEHLDLYTVKSGPGIVSELFSFRRTGGDTDYALRPEFTPTLARMIAARGAQFPKPIRWFSMPSMFRAERPQRGRLREHFQWNLDVVGDPSPRAEVDLIAAAVNALARFGLTPDDVQIRLSHRVTVGDLLAQLGLDPARHADAFALLDRRDKMAPEQFEARAAELGFTSDTRTRFLEITGAPAAPEEIVASARSAGLGADVLERLSGVLALLGRRGLLDWIQIDLGIVRGLAYYTGTVFEVHERRGQERAIAGGGRYDQLVELFGGPSTPAVGFAMGDVVLRLVLEDRGKLDPPAYQPRPDVFVVDGRNDEHAALDAVVHDLRGRGFHVRHSAKTTKNIGKLLGEANKAGARYAVILDDDYDRHQIALKDLAGGEQQTIDLSLLPSTLTRRLAAPGVPSASESPS